MFVGVWGLVVEVFAAQGGQGNHLVVSTGRRARLPDAVPKASPFLIEHGFIFEVTKGRYRSLVQFRGTAPTWKHYM